MHEREKDLIPKGKFGFKQKHKLSKVSRGEPRNITKSEREWCGAQVASFGVNITQFQQLVLTRWIK